MFRLPSQRVSLSSCPKTQLLRALLALALPLGVGLPGTASANGRVPATVNVEFQPGDDSLILLPTTFGLTVSTDDGASFRWICEDTIGYGGTYDPDYALTEGGDIYATTFSGLRISTDGGCSFTDTEFWDHNEPAQQLTDIWVGEVEVASDGKIWAATSTGTGANDVFVSTDGTTFSASNLYDDVAWWKSLKVSKSNPDVIYVAGFLIAEVDGDGNIIKPAEALFHFSDDGGATWTDRSAAVASDISFGSQPNLQVLGVSPSDPATVFVRAIGVTEPVGDALYRSTDSGATWEHILALNDTMTAFAIRDDGTVIAGTSTPCEGEPLDMPKGCVFISPTGAPDSFTKPTTEPRMGCVGERSADGDLFACGSNWDPDNKALGRSPDDGQTWTKVVRFSELAGPLECPQGTKQHECETLIWPSVCQQLGICAVADAGPGADSGHVNLGDAGTGGGGGGVCGCQSSSSSTPLVLALALFVLVWSRRPPRARR
jgi:uncharacterized protein (TIGR03382 family)